MVGASHILHAAEIIGAFLMAHHFWPKGIIYSGKEDWEERHHKKHGNKSSSSSKRNRRRDGIGRRHSRDEDERERDRNRVRRRSRHPEDYVERRGSRYYDEGPLVVPVPRSGRRERDYYYYGVGEEECC